MRTQLADPLGRGRSGVVFRAFAPVRAGESKGTCRPVAVKVFRGDKPATLVHYLLSGASNPYEWNEDAVCCTALRREILADLVCFWFGAGLRVAAVVHWEWNRRFRAFCLAAELVDGVPAKLHHSFSPVGRDEARELTRTVMRPLQAWLREAGFDGLIWQAGQGNPVAASNFLRLQGTDRGWMWIDLESGVPALFPLNPWHLVRTYLPLSLKHRRPLFDDVDIAKLRAYVTARRPELERFLGEPRYRTLGRQIDRLDRHQLRWKSLRRGDRGITCQTAKGRLSEERALWYRNNLVRWHARECVRLIGAAAREFGLLAIHLGRRILSADLLKLGRATVLLFRSQRFRARIARRYVATRIQAWRDRRQLSAIEQRQLRTCLRGEESSTYLADFGMHIALKPIVKGAQWGIVAPLGAAGLLRPVVTVLLLVTGGMLARTLYTGYRLIETSMRGAERPWMALLVGLLPVFGNVAYPFQIAYSGSFGKAGVARFIVYDSVTRIGERTPIWGGRDTLTEHFFNRLAHRMMRPRLVRGDCSEAARH